jgi:formiminoglutamate deiminase
MIRRHAQLAVLDGRVAADVLIDIDDGGITAVTRDAPAPPDAERLTGLTLPGFANTHSHAFHRALRGRTHDGTSTFWTWREKMYAVAERLDPDSYLALARAVYAEMALAGICCVGEFHYLHHRPDGTPYDDANAMSAALAQAADEAGIRITLLDTCYLTGGIGEPLSGVQRGFGDGDADGWIRRVAAFQPVGRHAKMGAAVHSVRAVPAGQIPTVSRWAGEQGWPLHVHLSEQRGENDACDHAYGKTPTRLLADAGALGPRTVAVHAVHLRRDDIELLGDSGAGICLCPTTERDLADGIAPARALADAGCPLSVGSDSHAMIDPLIEARSIELDERLRSEIRGNFTSAALLDAATATGHAALGWPGAGRIAPGAPADLVTVDLDGVRLAGIGADDSTALDGVVYAGTAADVRQVMVGGREVVRDGVHLLVDDVPGELRRAIGRVTT